MIKVENKYKDKFLLLEQRLEKQANKIKNLRLELKVEGEMSIFQEEVREVVEECKMNWELRKEQISKM